MPKPVKDLTVVERTIINEISILLERKHLSRYELSKKTMITQAGLSTMFNFKNSPSLYTLVRIFEGLDIEPGDFFHGCFDKQSKVLTGDEKLLLAKWEMLNDKNKSVVIEFINNVVVE